MSPISNASRLADFGSGIGTQGAVIQVDNTNQRVGIGTTNPQAMLQVGTAISMFGSTGIVSATTFYGSGSGLTGVGETIAPWYFNPPIDGTDALISPGIGITFNKAIFNGSGEVTAKLVNAVSGAAGTTLQSWGISSVTKGVTDFALNSVGGMGANKTIEIEASTLKGLFPTISVAAVLTFLNPHVYLDTMILIGSISQQFSGFQKITFALGASLASFVFFFSLAYGSRLLTPLMHRPFSWKVLDSLIALIMFTIAFNLAKAGNWL